MNYVVCAIDGHVPATLWGSKTIGAQCNRTTKTLLNRPNIMKNRFSASWFFVTALSAFCLTGCAAFHPVDGVPVNQVPAEFRAAPRSGKVPINFSLLRQTPPAEYRVDSGDLLGIFVEGILAKPGESAPVTIPNNPDSNPSLGFPILVQDDGTISLPSFPELYVRGMTLREIRERIRIAYTEENPLFQKGVDEEEALILVNLQRKRTYRVLVVRQESNETNFGSGAPSQIDLNVVRRGTGAVVQLPAYENDVMHALTQTGGLPSSDAENAVYIIRRRPRIIEHQPIETPSPAFGPSIVPQPAPVPYAPVPVSQVGHSIPRRYKAQQPTMPNPTPRTDFQFGPNANPYNTYRGAPRGDGKSRAKSSRPGYTIRGQSPVSGHTVTAMPSELFLDGCGFGNPEIIRIPMRVYPGEALPFAEPDIILQAGDIVFVESRETEFFFTGGLLGGGQYVLPQNYDLDLLEALSIVQSQVNTSFNSNTRAIGGVSALNHDVTVGASKVIILRKAPNGCEIKIEVDLYDAVHDPSERIVIKPGDYVLLQYTRTEAVAAFFERHILEGAVVGAASSLVFGN